MSLPIVCIPPVLTRLYEPYRKIFTKPQFKHFKRLITGLIVSPNKTLQEINDAFGERDQSNLNRFINGNIDRDALNVARIEQIRQNIPSSRKGILIVDESLLHKTGRKMELAGAHRSGITKRIEWGHMIVNSIYCDTTGVEFPVKTDVYVQEKHCADKVFYTKRELALQQVQFALKNKLPVHLVIADAGYEGEEFTRTLKQQRLDFMVGVRVTTNISIERQKRISIGDYVSKLTDANFDCLVENDQTYFYHLRPCNIRGIGKVKLVISYVSGDEDNVKCYITNLDEKNEIIMKLLLKRWCIECFHRDAKQHLGLEACQVRKGRGMQIVALACLIAYTLVKLAACILKTPLANLRTVGEICRYLGLIAYKGVAWMRSKLKDQFSFIKLLKQLVFVKNAKV